MADDKGPPNDDNVDNIGDGQTPEPFDFAGFEAVVGGVFDKKIAAFQNDVMIPALKQLGATIVQQIPTAEKLVALIRGEVAATQGPPNGVMNGTEAASLESYVNEAPAQAPTKGLSGLGAAIQADPLGSILTLADGLIDKFVTIKTTMAQAEDPFLWAQALALRNPALARFVGSQLAPDPVAGQIPAIVATSTQNAFALANKIHAKNYQDMVSAGWRPGAEEPKIPESTLSPSPPISSGISTPAPVEPKPEPKPNAEPIVQNSAPMQGRSIGDTDKPLKTLSSLFDHDS